MDERTGRVVMPLNSFPIVEQIEFAEYAARPRPPYKWTRREYCELPSRAFYEWYATRGIDPDKRPRRRDKLSPWVISAVLERDGNLCGICGEPAEEPPHLDHIHPWSAGGEDNVDNLQVAHPKCNIEKGARVA